MYFRWHVLRVFLMWELIYNLSFLLFKPQNFFPQPQTNFGGSNIHVAFQNMSITTHPSNPHVQVGQTNQIPIPVNLPPSPEQISSDMNGHHSNRLNYMNEQLYVPYFPNGKYGSQAPNPIPDDVSFSVFYYFIGWIVYKDTSAIVRHLDALNRCCITYNTFSLIQSRHW